MMFRLFRRKPCTHEKNYRKHKFNSEDGTPMIEFHCYDCGWQDNGHVYGESWKEPELKVVRDGHLIINEKSNA